MAITSYKAYGILKFKVCVCVCVCGGGGGGGGGGSKLVFAIFLKINTFFYSTRIVFCAFSHLILTVYIGK